MAYVVSPCGNTYSTDFSFQNLVFWNLFEFSEAEIIFKNQYLPHSESKSYQINSIKILLIKIFPTTPKAHSNSSKIFSYDLFWFSVKKSFNIQELLHSKSKHHETKPMHPSPWELSKQTKYAIWSIPVQWISSVQNKTKQTYYLASWIDVNI